MTGQSVVCKQTFSVYGDYQSFQAEPFVEIYIQGRIYQVKEIYTDLLRYDPNTLEPQPPELTWIIIGEDGRKKSFTGPDTKEPKTFQRQPRLTDYFYLPEEWREIQLEKLCI